jgi:hypothetical protein
MQSWFLLYFRDVGKREIRIELSRGVGFTVLNIKTGHGIVSDFAPRLYIEPISLEAQAETTSSKELEHEHEHIDIDVTRRSG